jgi:hypothetical protein
MPVPPMLEQPLMQALLQALRIMLLASCGIQPERIVGQQLRALVGSGRSACCRPTRLLAPFPSNSVPYLQDVQDVLAGDHAERVAALHARTTTSAPMSVQLGTLSSCAYQPWAIQRTWHQRHGFQATMHGAEAQEPLGLEPRCRAALPVPAASRTRCTQRVRNQTSTPPCVYPVPFPQRSPLVSQRSHLLPRQHKPPLGDPL